MCVCCRLQDQMRLMMFAQWFELLQNIFEYFLLFLTRIKVHQLTLFTETLCLLISCFQSECAFVF